MHNHTFQTAFPKRKIQNDQNCFSWYSAKDFTNLENDL